MAILQYSSNKKLKQEPRSKNPMASNQKLLFLCSAAVLLSVLTAATAAAADGADQEDDQNEEWWCYPGKAFPHNPLGSCRTYVISRVCHRGPGLPMLVKERCCRELAAVHPERCRREALRVLMDGVVVEGGRVGEGRLGDLRGCPRDLQTGFAATLLTPAQCGLRA